LGTGNLQIIHDLSLKCLRVVEGIVVAEH